MKIAAFAVAAAAAASTLAVGLSVSAQDFNQRPTYGAVNLRTGYTPDPHVRQIQSGGSVNAQRLGNNCVGMIANAPDYRVTFQAGQLPLTISATSQTDTTLVINGPDGRWYCNDDGGNNGLNPSLVFRRPASGQYDVWVGTYGRAALAGARLEISELYSQ